MNEVSILLTGYLHENGFNQVIAPIPSRHGRLWVELEPYKLILSPYIVGKDAYEIPFSPDQWQMLGSLVRQYHDLPLPPSILEVIPREDWSSRWRLRLRKILDQAVRTEYPDPLSSKLAAVLHEKRDLILDIVQRAEELAAELQAQPGEFVLCHADLHPGNLLITPDGSFFLVDWDDPVLAPRERDLMFPGGGQGFIGLSSHEEEAWFYRGYRGYAVNSFTLAYYRFERVIIDIVLFAEMIQDPAESIANREQAFTYLVSNFRPGEQLRRRTVFKVVDFELITSSPDRLTSSSVQYNF